MHCLHEEKNFRVSSFKVIREDNRNYLVSPYYAKSGGMVIDWMEPDEDVDAGVVRTVKKEACNELAKVRKVSGRMQ